MIRLVATAKSIVLLALELYGQPFKTTNVEDSILESYPVTSNVIINHSSCYADETILITLLSVFLITMQFVLIVMRNTLRSVIKIVSSA